MWFASARRYNAVLWAMCVLSSLLVTMVFSQRVAAPIDIQKERYFDGFGDVETSHLGEFRWSSPKATLLFPQQWQDYAWFSSHRTAQIIILKMEDVYEDQQLRIGNIQFAVDTQPRAYQILSAQQSTVSFVATKVNISLEQRELGIPLFSAMREATLRSTYDYGVLWLQVLAVLLVIIVMTAVLQRIVAIASPWWVSLIHVGIWIVWWILSPAGNGEILLAWGFVAVSLLLLRWTLTPWRWSWLVYLVILGVFMAFRVWAMGVQADLPSDIILANYKPYLPLPFEWEPYWSWSVWLLMVVGIRTLAGRDYIIDVWWVGCAAGCALLSMVSNGYWPAHGWMNVISLEYLGDWNGVWQFLRTSRVAVPPLLLITEFAVQHNTLLMLAYGWIIPRAILLLAMALAVFRGVTSPRERYIRGVLLLVWTYAFTMIKPLDNYFVYDFLLGAVLLYAIHLAYRSDIAVWQWAVVGVLLVVMDTLRPFGMLILVVVVPWLAMRSWRMHRIPGVVYLCVPLLLSVVWHGHHVVNLGQSNWSNHTGFNLCNAWECPTPPDMHPEAPPVADGLWTNINTKEHEENSRRLLKSGLVYQITHPVQTVVRTGELLYNIVVVPYIAGQPAVIGNGWWIDVYRVLMFGMMVIQLVLMVSVVRMLWVSLRTRTPVTNWYLVGHTCVIVLVLIIPNMVEYGENYRFIAGTAMWLAAIPAWHEYRSFVVRWLAIRSN